jgi:hypothetical protein
MVESKQFKKLAEIKLSKNIDRIIKLSVDTD